MASRLVKARFGGSVERLEVGRWKVRGGAVWPAMVVPVDVFEGCYFYLVAGIPGTLRFDQLGRINHLQKEIDGFNKQVENLKRIGGVC